MKRRKRWRTRITFSEPRHPFYEGEVVELEGLPGKYRIVWSERFWVTVEEMTWWDRVAAWLCGERPR